MSSIFLLLKSGSLTTVEWISASFLPLLVYPVKRLADLMPAFAAEGRKLQALHGRLAEERFHLAVSSQFKPGESTLLNVSVGEMLLPTSVSPFTAIPFPHFFSPARSHGLPLVYDETRGRHLFVSSKESVCICLLTCVFYLRSIDFKENRFTYGFSQYII